MKKGEKKKKEEKKKVKKKGEKKKCFCVTYYIYVNQHSYFKLNTANLAYETLLKHRS